jgi:hypothetical protein
MIMFGVMFVVFCQNAYAITAPCRARSRMLNMGCLMPSRLPPNQPMQAITTLAKWPPLEIKPLVLGVCRAKEGWGWYPKM